MPVHAIRRPVSYFLLLTAFALLHNKQATAQGRWKPGYIVTDGNDTLHGTMAYTEKAKAPKTILFKNDKTGLEKHYKPGEIKAFVVQTPSQQICFRSFVADLDISPADLASIDNAPAPKLQRCSFFAQLLVAGNRSLYTCRDTVTNKKHFLIEYPADTLTDLINKRYYLDNARTTALYNEQFKKQLGKLYAGCTAVSIQSINDAHYSVASLRHLANQYNTCEHGAPGTPYEYKREKARADLGVVLGASSTTVHMKGGDYNGITCPPSYFFNVGAFLNLQLPHTAKHLALYNELFFTHYNTSSAVVYPYTYESAQAVINLSYLKLATALRYSFAVHQLRPFLQAGMVNGYSISGSADEHTHEAGIPVPDQVHPITPFRHYEQSLFGGIGITFKRYEAEICYERGNGFVTDNSTYDPISVSTTYIMFLAKYSF